MATSTRRYSPIKGLRMRITSLDECGVPVTGSNKVITVAGFTQVGQAAQYEDGEEFITKTADAALCVNEKDPDILKRLTLTIDYCQIDPGFISVMGIGRLLTASEAPTGTGFAIPEGAPIGHFSLEVWQRVAGADACSGGVTRYVYNAWPHLFNAKIGDYNIANSPSTLQLIADSKAVSSLWTIGDTWLGSGAVSAIPDHWFQNLTSQAPPAVTSGIADL